MTLLRITLLAAVSGLLFTRVDAQSIPTNGLVAYYPFSGNAYDASGNGNVGTVYSADWSADRFGSTNSACRFYGNSGSYIDASLSNSFSFPEAITVSLWCAVEGNGYQSPRLFCMDTQNGAIELGYRPGEREFIWDYSPNNTVQPLSTWAGRFSNGQWLHLVGTATQASSQLYVNGILVTNVTGLSVGSFGNPTVLNIGRMPHWGWDAFDGEIDEVRIYNRVLSQSEVQQLYLIEAPEMLNIKKAVYLDSPNLKVGTNYQVQVSADMINWTNFGGVFAATNTTWRTTNYWDVDNWNQLFFRLQKQ